ncbi:MAG: F0F1 ATP synthase subunit epsilon [Natronincolaceae bacterium]|jgi:F-type H+-transporting ATPase subunit epsilon|nr:F0F1 ATP synthase subunit epsilon [Bacillota bacterium]NLK90347.1 F0F1 ATP synthase subunit epsilon [Clostridiales bacterium]
MASTFRLQIITPNRTFYDDEAESLVVTTMEGEMGVLAKHIPIVTQLAVGKIKIKKNGQYKIAAASEGFVKVDSESTRIVMDSAEWPEEIDVQRAEAAKKRAEERIESKESHVDIARAKAALCRATNRLSVAGRS